MSSKDKELSKSKFKTFIKNAKNPAGSTERSLRPEVEWELRPEQPVAQRCKILKDLSEAQLQFMNLEETAIIKLWDITKDLLVPTKSVECRHTALTFYKRLIYTQYKNLTYMREQFFLVIQNHEVPEDLKHRLELLDTLTENGKDIKNLEEKIGRFMLIWLQFIQQANLLRPYLEMLGNLIKFNAAHMDNEIIIGIVQNACNLSCTVADDDIGLQCLNILEMVMGYTIFPSDPLPQFVFTLCRTVNIVAYCPTSWKIWADMKCRTKMKISENAKAMKGTGGGPAVFNALTDIEKDIDRICHLSSAAAPSGVSIGVKSSTTTTTSTPILLADDQQTWLLCPRHPQRSYNHNLSLLSPKPPSYELTATTKVTSTPLTEKPYQKQPNKKRKLTESREEEREEVQLLKRQVEQNNLLVEEMKAQTRSIESMADSLRGIHQVMNELLRHLRDE